MTLWIYLFSDYSWSGKLELGANESVRLSQAFNSNSYKAGNSPATCFILWSVYFRLSTNRSLCTIVTATASVPIAKTPLSLPITSGHHSRISHVYIYIFYLTVVATQSSLPNSTSLLFLENNHASGSDNMPSLFLKRVSFAVLLD